MGSRIPLRYKGRPPFSELHTDYPASLTVTPILVIGQQLCLVQQIRDLSSNRSNSEYPAYPCIPRPSRSYCSVLLITIYPSPPWVTILPRGFSMYAILIATFNSARWLRIRFHISPCRGQISVGTKGKMDNDSELASSRKPLSYGRQRNTAIRSLQYGGTCNAFASD